LAIIYDLKFAILLVKKISLSQRKKMFIKIFFLYFLSSLSIAQSWIRVNQLGYKPESIKIAIFLSKEFFEVDNFDLVDAITDEVVFHSKRILKFKPWDGFNSSLRCDFSDFYKEGCYYIAIRNIKSPIFMIDKNIYNGTADFLLNYMRQQRCRFNPFLNDSCHTKDGFVIYNPPLDSTHIDVTGGWHDASDYLQYVTTSANATYQMLFAYEMNKNSFSDNYNYSGKPLSNSVPDILDEARWGIDWLLKMNPDDSIMYNQIADDRDHMSFRLPTEDQVDYGKGKERPVYFCTGEPQGIIKYKNRSNGIASTAGKFASAFALASEIFSKYDSALSVKLLKKSIAAYKYGKNHPGVCQTAPCRAPYFYEEDNCNDDMELAAVQLFRITGYASYLAEAIQYGREEKVIPWMGSDTAKHYQWYPFVNIGHYLLAQNKMPEKEYFSQFIQEGLERIFQKGKDNVFFVGIPFIWCSNNLIAAALTQLSLYKKLSEDKKYDQMEAMLRDWLFGCNPWGTSMIVGLPAYGDSPEDPHSAFSYLYNYKINGGLVDGPVYTSIYKKLLGINLYQDDEYKEFQNNFIVYHDDYGDYSTNEPTMDGTASLTYYLSSLETRKGINKKYLVDAGGITGIQDSLKSISIIFSGHEYADGAEIIINTLDDLIVKASFFFTGDFYRNENNKKYIDKLKSAGHYLGAHSDKHLLYCDSEKRDSLLVNHDEFLADLKNNYMAMKKFSINPNEAKYFLPPYEWYNQTISDWAENLGIKIINFSPGTYTNADYTIPQMNESYRDSKWIMEKIHALEKSQLLNGKILLIHFGTHPDRTDKFYNHLEELISSLLNKGYHFKRIDDLID